MPIVITATPGKIFQKGEKVTYAKLNQLGRPVFATSGTFGPSDMSTGDYSGVLSAGPYFYGLDTGTVNAAVVALTPAPAALVDGMLVAAKILNLNTGAATLDIGFGPAPVKKHANVDLEGGDWKPGQIACFRYQLDANVIPAASAYSAGGSLSISGIVVGRTYTWTKGANDTNCVVDGVTTLTASGTFVATRTHVGLTGTASALITASLIPSSNVWQMLSMLGNPPQAYYDFQPATAYRKGTRGLVPGPKVGQRSFYLRADGTWQDVLALTAATVGANDAQVEIFKWEQFN